MGPADEDYECEILRMDKPLRAFLHRLIPQAADLEDLLQETYAQLFRVPDAQRKAIQNVPAFAMTTARNIALNWLRHRRVVAFDSVEELVESSVVDEAADLEAIVHSHQQLLWLADGVSRLPRRCREVFSMRHVYGLSQKEIAERLGLTVGAVEQLLVRGMRRCLEHMEQPSNGRAQAARGSRGSLLDRWRRALKRREGEG